MDTKALQIRRNTTQARIMRLLTFICFFNFSGIHNGYALVGQISAPSAPAAASMVIAPFQACYSFVGSAHWISSVREQAAWFVDFTIRAQNWAQSLFQVASQSGVRLDSRSAGQIGVSAGLAIPLHWITGQCQSYLQKQEYWRQKDLRLWKHTPVASSNPFLNLIGSETKVLMQQAGFPRFAPIVRLKFRLTLYATGDDPAASVSLNRKGEIRNRPGIFPDDFFIASAQFNHSLLGGSKHADWR